MPPTKPDRTYLSLRSRLAIALGWCGLALIGACFWIGVYQLGVWLTASAGS
jgi:hypothetical protein